MVVPPHIDDYKCGESAIQAYIDNKITRREFSCWLKRVMTNGYGNALLGYYEWLNTYGDIPQREANTEDLISILSFIDKNVNRVEKEAEVKSMTNCLDKAAIVPYAIDYCPNIFDIWKQFNGLVFKVKDKKIRDVCQKIINRVYNRCKYVVRKQSTDDQDYLH